MTRTNGDGSGYRDAGLAIALAIVVTAYDVWILGAPLAPYFTTDGVRPEALVMARRSVGVVGLLAGQAVFFWAALSSPLAVRLVALALYGAVTFLEYGFVAGAGGVMNTQDIPMALQSVKYWPAMIRAFLDWRALVPIATFGAALLLPRMPAARSARRWILAVVMLLAVHGAYAQAHLKRIEFGDGDTAAPPPMSTFQSFFHTLAFAVSDDVAEALRPYRREEVTFTAEGVPRRHVILVIDESMSAGHLSLDGYARSTTPWLEALEREGRLTRWDEAAAATVYSNSSFLSLVTGFNAFPDLGHRVYTLPTIFQFAKAARYGTHLFDGQLNVRRFGLTTADMRAVDDWQTAAAFGDDPDTDMRMARAVARVLEAPTGQFVLVVKRGNHEPHEANYPKGAGPWRPSRDGDVSPGEERAAMINTYDNALRYNIDGFFHALLRPDGGLPRTVGLYTSDHGEELGESGRTPLVRKLVPNVVTVPLVMFGDDRPAVDTAYAASHHNIFATLLDLMNVPAAARPWSYSRSLLHARASDHDPRPVLSGYMFGEGASYEVRDFSALRDGGPAGLH